MWPWPSHPRAADRGADRGDRSRRKARCVEADLAPFDCVILCNVGRFSRDEAGVLRSLFAVAAAGWSFFLGDQVQPESYNQQLAGDGAEGACCRPSWASWRPEAQYRLDPLDYRHPIVAPFRGSRVERPAHDADLEVHAARRRFPRRKIALAFDNGDPAIVEERIGRGRSILVATAASPDSLDRTTDPPTPWTAISVVAQLSAAGARDAAPRRSAAGAKGATCWSATI